MLTSLTIGVIGGGASAVCLLDTLAEKKDLPRGRITVFEPSSHLWRGRPYQRDLDVVRVSAPRVSSQAWKCPGDPARADMSSGGALTRTTSRSRW